MKFHNSKDLSSKPKKANQTSKKELGGFDIKLNKPVLEYLNPISIHWTSKLQNNTLIYHDEDPNPNNNYDYIYKAIIAVGSADCTLRIIDSNTYKTLKAFYGFAGEINALSFHPTKRNRSILFAAAANKIYQLDLKIPDLIVDVNKKYTIKCNEKEVKDSKAKKNSIEAFESITIFSLDDDISNEINEISIDSHGHYLACVSDSGEVSVLNLKLGIWHKRWTSAHSNVAMVLKFHPSKHEIISGGMDQKILFWQLGKPEFYKEISIADTKNNSQTQLVNPAFVTCLSYHPTLPLLFVGLGDGGIGFISTMKGKSNAFELQKTDLIHNYSISSGIFLSINSNEFIITSGDDGLLIVSEFDPKTMEILHVLKKVQLIPFKRINKIVTLSYSVKCHLISIKVAVVGILLEDKRGAILIYQLEVPF